MKSRCLFAALMLFALPVLADESSVVGYWRTIDDVTGKPKAVIRITESQDHTLRGQILKIFPRPGFDQNEVCSHCEGDKHNQRIVGMTVMNNLKLDTDNQNLYTKGSILDPNNGKTYHCNVLLTQNGQQLEVRGYLGIPLFGRSQTWLRVDSA
jgi:uncharacterized protein (DUF2147 family)